MCSSFNVSDVSQGWEMWWDVVRCGEMWWDVVRCGEMWWDVVRYWHASCTKRRNNPKALDYERSHQASQRARVTGQPGGQGQQLFQRRRLSGLGWVQFAPALFVACACWIWVIWVIWGYSFQDAHAVVGALVVDGCRQISDGLFMSFYLSHLGSGRFRRWNHQFLRLLLGIRVAELHMLQLCHKCHKGRVIWCLW